MNLLGSVSWYLSTTSRASLGMNTRLNQEPRALDESRVMRQVHSQAKTSSPGVKDGEIQNQAGT